MGECTFAQVRQKYCFKKGNTLFLKPVWWTLERNDDDDDDDDGDYYHYYYQFLFPQNLLTSATKTAMLPDSHPQTSLLSFESTRRESTAASSASRLLAAVSLLGLGVEGG